MTITMNKQKMIEIRVDILKQMHKYIIEVIDDEECTKAWRTYALYGTTEEDFQFIAQDDDEWSFACRYFGKLIEE